MPAKLAFLTVGALHEPVGEPRVQGFVDRIPSVYAAAENSDGFHSRSIRSVETWTHSWGNQVVPACYRAMFPECGTDLRQFAMTLSLWDDLESVAAYAYNGAHAEALAKRKEWFAAKGLPAYVAWWVSEGEPVTWQIGADKLDHLHEHGPTPAAFNFASPFDAAGTPRRLIRELVQAKANRQTAG